jgi:hypothetical protein
VANSGHIRAMFIMLVALTPRLATGLGPSFAPTKAQAGQAQAPTKSASTAASTPVDPAAGVEVTAQALPPSKFCALGADGYVVYVPLDITVANGRRTPIILTRYLHIQRVLLGKSSEDVQAQRYELATPVRAYRSFGEGVNFGPKPSDDSFVVLKHNQTYEFTAVEGIPVRNNAADKMPGTAYPGALALSIELQTWPFFREASTVQKDWSQVGDLISAPVISYPTLIKLDAHPPVEKCGLLAP